MSKFFTTNAPYPPHWTLNSCFGTFRTVWMQLGLFCCLAKLSAKRAEKVQLMQEFMPRSRVEILRNKRPGSTHWTLNSCFGMFLTVWMHLGLLCCLAKLGTNRTEMVQLMQKFMP